MVVNRFKIKTLNHHQIQNDMQLFDFYVVLLQRYNIYNFLQFFGSGRKNLTDRHPSRHRIMNIIIL